MAKQVAHVSAEDLNENPKKIRKSSNKRPMKPVHQYRVEIEQEIASSIIEPIPKNFFKKTKAEKEMLKAMKAANRENIRRKGNSPKKKMN